MPSYPEFNQEKLNREILRSENEIRCFRAFHLDFQPDNILCNAELRRALIIGFHLMRVVDIDYHYSL